MSHDHGHDHPHHLCVQLAERISEYLDGEQPLELKVSVEEHLGACSNCEKFVDSLRRTRDLAHLLPVVELPPERMKVLSESVKRRLES